MSHLENVYCVASQFRSMLLIHRLGSGIGATVLGTMVPPVLVTPMPAIPWEVPLEQ